MPILRKFETKVNTFLFMYMNSCDVIICYLELWKTRSVFPIPLEFEISKFACTCSKMRAFFLFLLLNIITIFHLKILIFTVVKNCFILQRHVIIMFSHMSLTTFSLNTLAIKLLMFSMCQNHLILLVWSITSTLWREEL